MLDKVKEWAFEGEMDGFDTLAAEQVGFDYMSLLKGAGGMLSGAGGMMSAQQSGQAGTPAAGTPAAVAAEQQLLAMQKLQAESSARTWKIVGGIALAVVGLGGVALLMRPRTVP